MSLKVKNLGVHYEVPRFAGTLFSQTDPYQKPFSWDLEGITFELFSGEAMGIIGENGSGKSTILKAIAGLVPYKGIVETSGKIFCALDLNLFFHPDFSGFDNLFMMNACYGQSDEELKKNLPWICEFSELGDFVHRPVREYSTGMRLRLGISYVLFQDFQVLLLDEVLSVGDLAFQRKCLSRLHSLLDQGACVVLSSHNLDELAHVCSQMIYLRSGKVQMQGRCEDVLSCYMQESEKKGLYVRSLHRGVVFPDPSLLKAKIRILHVRFLNSLEEECVHFHAGEEIFLEFHLEILSDWVKKPLFRVEFFRNDGLLVQATNNYRHENFFDLKKGEACVCLKMNLNLLASRYYVSVSIWPDEFSSLVVNTPYDYREKEYDITVFSQRSQGTGVSFSPASFFIKT